MRNLQEMQQNREQGPILYRLSVEEKAELLALEIRDENGSGVIGLPFVPFPGEEDPERGKDDTEYTTVTDGHEYADRAWQVCGAAYLHNGIFYGGPRGHAEAHNKAKDRDPSFSLCKENDCFRFYNIHTKQCAHLSRRLSARVLLLQDEDETSPERPLHSEDLTERSEEKAPTFH